MPGKNKLRFGLCLFFICGFIFMFFTLPADAAAQTEVPALKQGMSGEDVVRLQTKLQEYGYYQDEIDGNFGMNTKLALMDFQMDCDLEADGVARGQTMEALRNFRAQDIVNRGQSEGRKGRQLAYFAQQFVGVPYVWAGRSVSGFDCSGFIYYLFANYGIEIPRMADEQFEVGLFINKENLQLGDLVFFSTYEPGASHVGMYIGSGQFIHASSGAGEVVTTSLAKQYYLERYLGARRIMK